MEITFKWIWNDDSFGCLPIVDNKKDYVIQVNWRYRATHKISDDVNQDITYDDYGQSTFKVEEDQKDYIPFNELTEEIILGWLNLNVSAMEEKLKKIIEDKINPPIIYPGVPFASGSN